ncbi:FG-GAP-like repeat-containing protein, partial [Sphingomonas sp. LT1P40]|uniref:FG-GAP-like repeat-containing protein n=1 Tax=Alteristakelama amylovorans TaxID=3096166 RepID=UPI002FCB31AE
MVGTRIGGIAADVTFSDGGAARSAPRLLNGNIYFVNPATWVAGGTLTVSGVASYDRISILHEGNAAGEVGVSGSTLFFGGVEIGTVSGGEGTNFTVTFNGAAGADAVTAVTERLAYQLGQGGIVTDHSLNIALVDGAGVAVANAGQWEQVAGADYPNYDIGALVTSSLFRPVLGDLNGDGYADLILTGVTVPAGEWRLVDESDPAFNEWQENITSPQYEVREDGTLWIRDADDVQSATAVYINDQNGGFTELGDAGTGTSTGINGALADVDGDGDLDLFWSSLGPSRMVRSVFVSYNLGDGTFHYVTQVAGTESSLLSDGGFDVNTYVAAGDVDGNGTAEINVGIAYGTFRLDVGGYGLVWMLPGAYSGEDFFGKPFLFDYDGDGDLDALSLGINAHYFENVGDGQFVLQHGADNPFTNLLSFNNWNSFGDLDADGDLDLVIVGPDGATQILWNNSSYGAQSNSTDGSIDLAFTFPETVAPDAYAIDEDQPLVTNAATGVLLNDTIPGTLTAVLASGPAHGSLTLNADGSFTYTPTANYHGIDSFTYRVNDGTTLSEPVTVSLTINSVTDTIIAVDDLATTLATGTATIQGLANDLNPENRSVAVSAINGVSISGPVTTVTLPSGATLEARADGQFIYNPGNAFDRLVSPGTGAATGLASTATDSFTYSIDGSTATVSVTVTGVDGPGDAAPARVGGIAADFDLDDAATARAAPQLLNGAIYFTDAANWTPGGTLSVTGVAAYDRISILHEGNGAGEVGVSGSTLFFGGVEIGTVSGGNGTNFTVAFNEAASADAVTAVTGRLAYQLGQGGAVSDHSLNIALVDGAGVAAANAGQWEQVVGADYPTYDIGALVTSAVFRPVLGDLNGDGYADLILTGVTVKTGEWYLVRYDDYEFDLLTETFTSIEYAQFEDGLWYVRDADIVDSATRVYLNDQNGGFALLGDARTGTSTGITGALADMDGDGDLDFFWASHGPSPASRGIAVSYNLGDGTFHYVADFAEVFSSDLTLYGRDTYLAAGDISADGTVEVLAAIGWITLRLNVGGGGHISTQIGAYTGQTGFPGSDPYGQPFLIDYDGDGDLDAISAGGSARYYENVGGGLVERHGSANPFAGLVPFNGTTSFGDLDGDGDLDLVIANGTGNAQILWNNSSYGAQSNSTNGSIQLNFGFTTSNFDPVLDLQLAAVIEADEASYRAIAEAAIVTDADSADFADGQLVVTFVDGASADEGVFIGAQIGITAIGGTILYNGLLVGTYTGGDDGQPLVVTFTALATAGAVQQVVRSLIYFNNSFDTAENRDISFVLTDGDGGTSAVNLVTVHIETVDTPLMPGDDYASTLADATVVIDVRANDVDPDGGVAETIDAIDGMAIVIGQTVTLASGARVTLNEDGTLTYNPNGRFNALVSEARALLTGAFNAYGNDGFTYTLSGGIEVWVELEIVGVDGPGDQLWGSFGNDTLTGPSGAASYFDLSQGGTDSVNGGAANDAFLMGAALDASDSIDGGTGINDQVGLRGDYAGANALVLGSTTLRNIDTIGLLASPGDSYDITTHND